MAQHDMDRWQYLIVLGACLAITAPLEILRRGRLPAALARRPRGAAGRGGLPRLGRDRDRRARLDLQPALHHRSPTCRCGIPLEELLFFIVIPLCGLLTYNAVNAMLDRVRKLRPTDRAAR